MKQKVGQKTGTSAVSKVGEKREKLVRDLLAKAKDNIESGYLELSELLSEAYHKEFHLAWGFTTFEEYCHKELDMAYRRAMYLSDIWDKVKTLDLPKARVAKLGWSKMKEVAAVITKKNAEKLLKSAESMTTRELVDHVRTMRRSDTGGKGGKRQREQTFRLNVVFGETEGKTINDALDEAKKMIEQDSTALALEAICSEWMESKGAQPEATALEDWIAYLEKHYPVTITFKMKKKTSEAAKQAQEVLDETEEPPEEPKSRGKKNAKKKAPAKKKMVDKGEDDLNGEDEEDFDVNKLIGIDD